MAKRRSERRRLFADREPTGGKKPSRAVDPKKLREACAAAASAFEACAKHARDASLREDAALLAAELAMLAETRTRMSDRLRWDWLATTWSLIDGAPDARLVGEGLRLLDEAAVLDDSHAVRALMLRAAALAPEPASTRPAFALA